MVNVKRPGWVQVTERVVAQGSQVDNGIETVEICRRNISEVFPKGRNVVRGFAKGTFLKEIGIQSNHLMSASLEDWNGN